MILGEDPKHVQDRHSHGHRHGHRRRGQEARGQRLEARGQRLEARGQRIEAYIRSHWLLAGWLGGSGLAGSAAGQNIRFELQKQFLLLFFLVFLQKPSKTIRFHAFFEASKCRISHYSATLSPFAILAPKCQFHEVFLRSKSISDAPAQWGARSGSAGTSPLRTHSLSYRSKNPICQRHVQGITLNRTNRRAWF